MENLNAEQVKRGLEHCTDKSYKCEECPYFYKSEGLKSSMEILMTDALSLITSQEQRIKELTEENEKLIASRDMWMSTAYCEKDGVNSIKADTVHRMQDRFAVHYGTYTYDDKVKLVEVFRVLDKIAREIAEGG